jgi:hypothetical protein
MTTLELIQNTPDIDTLRGLFIAITAEQKTIIEAAQDPGSSMRVSPLPLTDGRHAFCADILSEIHPGGIFHAPFSSLTLTTINETEVITKEQFLALRPADPVIEEEPPA